MKLIARAATLGCLFTALTAGSTRAAAQVPASTPPASAALDLARQLNQAFIDVAERVTPSVVVIRVAHKPNSAPSGMEDDENPLWDLIPREFRKQWERQREEDRQQQEERGADREPVWDGQGSGVVIREDGYILTNDHVVDGAEKIKIRFLNGRTYDATVRGRDPQSDIAVLKIEARGLPAVKFSDSTLVKVGEFAIAIGAPFELDHSVTIGHVSAKGRSQILPSMGGRSPAQATDQDFIQTDASINPGNSGGPLVNLYGEIIGINTLIRGMRTGIGFAVPSNLAREVSDQLIENGRFVRAWLGVSIDALRDDEDFKSLVKGLEEGVIVRRIFPNTPAARSELRASDVITYVDGRKVTTPVELKAEIRGKKPGEAVTLKVVRRDKTLEVKVRPEAWPEPQTAEAGKTAPAVEAGAGPFGLAVSEVKPELAEKFQLGAEKGVVVTQVERGSIAERKGLRPGDLITEVNHKAVTTPRQFRDALQKGDPARGILLNILSEGVSKFEILKETAE